MTKNISRELKSIRILLGLFIIGLILSGITAFPLIHELKFLDSYFGLNSELGKSFPILGKWISQVYMGLSETNAKYPFILYGTDWLAFSHLVIATAFIGPFRDPIKNKWVIQFGLIACAAIIPLAFICGPIRGIPFYWRLIDCSFGVFGSLPLILVLRQIANIETSRK